MDPCLSTAAARVFSGVLADFAFLFGDAVAPEELPAPDGPCFLACLPFHGRLEGNVTIVVSESLAMEIAANTLGREPSDPEVCRRAQDAVREVASVIGGHLVSALAEPGGDVQLTPPVLFLVDPSDWERMRSEPETQCFSVDGRPAMLRVALKQEGAA